jgi:hypothetical protein
MLAAPGRRAAGIRETMGGERQITIGPGGRTEVADLGLALICRAD